MYQRWTAADRRLLAQYLGLCPITDLAARLNRSASACYRYIARQNLRTRPDPDTCGTCGTYTSSQLIAVLGISMPTLHRWSRLGLPHARSNYRHRDRRYAAVQVATWLRRHRWPLETLSPTGRIWVHQQLHGDAPDDP